MKKEFRNTERCAGVTAREASLFLRELETQEVTPGRHNHNKVKGWTQYNHGFGRHNSLTLASMPGRSHHMPDFPSWYPARNRWVAHGGTTGSDWG